MAMYVWDDSLSVENDALDTQHKQLFEILNRLDSSVGRSQSEYSVLEVIAELEKYIDEHFRDEEELLLQLKYTRYEYHKSRHEYFVEKVLMLKNEIANGRSVSAMDLLCFLARWLREHIKNDDKEYTDLLKGA